MERKSMLVRVTRKSRKPRIIPESQETPENFGKEISPGIGHLSMLLRPAQETVVSQGPSPNPTPDLPGCPEVSFFFQFILALLEN
jgi:hypothetical protein